MAKSPPIWAAITNMLLKDIVQFENSQQDIEDIFFFCLRTEIHTCTEIRGQEKILQITINLIVELSSTL